jgi:hypothetical protein
LCSCQELKTNKENKTNKQLGNKNNNAFRGNLWLPAESPERAMPAIECWKKKKACEIKVNVQRHKIGIHGHAGLTGQTGL